MVINKRIPKLLKINLIPYICLFLLVFIGLFMVIDINTDSRTIINGVSDYQKEANLEDGEFVVKQSLTDEEIKSITDKGIDVENLSYMDYERDNSTVRVFRARQKINIESAVEGNTISEDGTILIEKKYASTHNLQIGNSIQIDGEEFEIVGIGCSVDYDYVLENDFDFGADSSKFGTVFVTGHDYKKLQENDNSKKTEVYMYAFKLNDKMEINEFKNYIKNLNVNMISLTSADSNPRIGASAAGCKTADRMCTLSAIILLFISSLLISTYVSRIIEKERMVIGTLYAMGTTKKELLRHYILLPLLIISSAGILGTLTGILCYSNGIKPMDVGANFSIPNFEASYPVAIICIGIIAPPLISLIVNIITINKKISLPVTEIMKPSEKKVKKIRTGNRKRNFASKFKYSHILSEMKCYIIVLIGMFLGLFLLMIGFEDYVMEKNMVAENKRDIKFEYMYTYQYAPEDVPTNGEPVYVESFLKEAMGIELGVSVLGIEEDNPYFEFDVSHDKDKVTISSSVAQKYNLAKGDKLVMFSNTDEKEYEFIVDKIVQYSAGLYVFMDIDTMRESFGKSDNYFNTVLSDKPLDVDMEMVYALTTKQDIVSFAEKLLTDYRGMHIMMFVFGSILFAIIMYLMVNLMIDRSKREISIMKLFGYQNNEIRSLFLDGNFVAILVSAIICVPASKKCMDMLMPSFCAEYSCGFNLSFKPIHYIVVFAMIFAVYFVVTSFLNGKLKKIPANDIIKNVE